MDNEVALRMAREIALAMERPISDSLGEGELADWYRRQNVLNELLRLYRTPAEQEYLQGELDAWNKQRPVTIPEDSPIYTDPNHPLYVQRDSPINKLHEYVQKYTKKEQE